jgi:hypothetical protein
MNIAIGVIFAHVALAVLTGWWYFRRYTIQRPPLGVMNLWDIALMLGGIILVPYLYLALPRWVVAGLLGLGLLGIVYFTVEPVLPWRWLRWLVVIVLLGLEIGLAWGAGAQSTLFFAVNNIAQLLAVIGITNLWAQSGLKARDAAILGAVLTLYDFLFTSLLGMMTELFGHLANLPFAPMIAWPAGNDQGWLAIGLGDLLLATVFPLVMRKAFGWSAGLTAMFIALGAIGTIFILPLLGLLSGTFPVMVVLGPLMVLQYLYWRRRCGLERTTWQYLQAEPLPVA